METAERQSRQPDTSDAPYPLTLPEIQWIERQMNRMLIQEDAALVHGESQLHVGQVPCCGSRAACGRSSMSFAMGWFLNSNR